MTNDAPLNKTPLYDLHVQQGARMVPFTGYEMPVQYSDGIVKEHLHTREKAGLFDVSHMGQVIVRGSNVAQQLEALIPVELQALKDNQQVYGVLTNADGGIMDDLIVTRWDADTFFLVVNAACKENDFAHLAKHLPNCEQEILDNQALVALQGPMAKDVMADFSSDACKLTFMNGTHTLINGVECFVTRSGYTGEDGFEISVPAQHVESLVNALLSNELVKLIGLGARDSLRLEAGLCLYGHDMNEETSPIEASLIWSITKTRRADGSNAGGFIGEERIFADIANGVSKKRVGFAVEGKAPVREGAEIVDADGKKIGQVTSGGFGPTLGAPVAMGYVDIEHAKVGTEVQAIVRGKPRKLTVAKTPFVPQRYYRG
ncbi:glycine cleavage system aminomethyltransferase GcvT [Maricurvus nonylphenolicus]|uniref:glycine cleavage system aminomethyltransferase GcvT n=1 Tax=Maricurvus nonylphenolicus TaxID=1008307 RepID=UPI0036F22354